MLTTAPVEPPVTLADHPLDAWDARAFETAAARLEDLSATRVGWLRRYAQALVLVDAAALLLASALGVTVHLLAVGSVGVVPLLLGSLVLLPVWLTTLTFSRCYETRFLGTGTEEFKRVGSAAFRVAAWLVFLLFMTRAEVPRGFLAVALPAGLGAVVAGRYAGRKWLHARRRRGLCTHRVVVVGTAADALELTTTIQHEPLSGLMVVGACVTGERRRFEQDSMVPVLGTLTDVLPVLTALQADTVVVAKGPGVTPDALRRLSHELEGTGIDLLVSPQLTNVSGSRITWRTLPGLPLLHLDEPELDGSRRLVKATFDRLLGLVLLVVAAPVLLGAALAIRVSSRGPAFFRQDRVGRSGETFRIWKLRTMHVDAEQQRLALADLNVHAANGVLFKVLDDPRITPLGRLLRRYSLDELPQLLNVVLGHMSLVGPRPPLRSEVDKYDPQVHRRLLVKPGMTGLWQVSGRADLPWEEAVRLDLHYVENWSLGLDVAVLCKTVLAVLRPSGAY